MADPAQSGPESGELEELRRLLVGPELEQLTALNERVVNPVKRATDVAEALPAAIRTAKAKPLREALEPVFEKAFSASVRRNPRELADAIYPIMGPAIRNSIAAAIRDFAEALNQIVEKSVSIRSLKWRVESMITGKPFAEILLARSMRYAVEQVFLVHRASGLLLLHVAAHGSVLKDVDMISGMLTAIQDFLSDSFTEGGQNLETVDAGQFKLWLTYSPKVLLVGAVSGTAPVELRQVFRRALDRIDELLANEINNFKQDDLSVFEPARPILEECLLGQPTSPAKAKTAKLWLYLGVVTVVLVALIGWRLAVGRRWDSYFQALRTQPGIVVTNIEKRGSVWVISGLKDPGAEDPAKLLDARQLKRGDVQFALQPFLSMDPRFAARRALQENAGRIQRQIIRFDSNSSHLAISEEARIEDLALEIGELLRAAPAARIAITGHSDESGAPAANEKLSIDRANHVADALAAQGVRREALDPSGVGNSNPLRRGASEFDQATNRGVSFTVTVP